MNRLPIRCALAVGTAFLAAACATPEPAVSDADNMLASAGFAAKKPNTPERQAALKSLPPHQFVARTINGVTKYVYADPTVCGCLYVGDQRAYDRYRQNIATAQTATDDQIRAILSSSPLPGESGL